MKKSSDYWNLDGSAFAYLAQQAEKTCLLCMYDFLRKRKYTIGALIHDGMHVQGKVSQSVLDECSQRVYDDIGFRVQIVPKEFDNFDEQLNNVHTVETDCDAAEIIVKQRLVGAVRVSSAGFIGEESHVSAVSYQQINK